MKLFKILLTIILTLGLNYNVSAASYKGETAVAGGPPGTIFIAFAAQASKGGVDIEVNAGKNDCADYCCNSPVHIALKKAEKHSSE